MIYWILAQPTQLGSQLRRFSSGFSSKTIIPLRSSVTILVSKDAQLKSASFDMNKKFVQGCPPTQTPTQKFQNDFSVSVSHGIMDILVSFEMIFQATNLGIQIDDQISEVENSKIPGIQPSYRPRIFKLTYSIYSHHSV